MKKIAVIGSRNFNDYKFAEAKLDRLRHGQRIIIVSGGARGADRIGKLYAENYDFDYLEFLPDWEAHGKGAGFLRNTDIVNACDEVVAFWDGKSNGTRDSIRKAQKMRKHTHIYYV